MAKKKRTRRAPTEAQLQAAMNPSAHAPRRPILGSQDTQEGDKLRGDQVRKIETYKIKGHKNLILNNGQPGIVTTPLSQLGGIAPTANPAAKYLHALAARDAFLKLANSMRPPTAAPSADAAPGDNLDGLLPAISESSYTHPFDQASDVARQTYAAATPDINSTYDRLGGQLTSGAADEQVALGRNRQDLVSQLAASRGELAGIGAQQLASPIVQDGSLLNAAHGEIAARAAAQTQNADGRLALADRFAQIQQQSADARGSDAGLARSAALSNASTNLQQLLGAIGLKRADAQRQYANDSMNRSLKLHDLKRQDAQDKLAQATATHKAVADASTTPRQDFEANYPTLAEHYPVATQVFQFLTAAAKGKGRIGYAEAKRLLESKRHDMESGTLAIDASGTPIGKRINVDQLDQWLQAFYDDKTKSLSDRARQELLDAGYQV